MPEFITIEEAARTTGFPSAEIQQWAISKKITSYIVKQGVRLVDLTSLRGFISHIERLGIQKLYLQLIIQDKEEEINEIIAQHDDYLLCLRSLKTISPLLKQIIAELSTFIHDKQDRYIFTEITSGAKISDVAKRCDISYDRMCYRYKNILLRLQENIGFLAEYKKTIKLQDQEIESLRLENRKMEYELKKLYKKTLENGLYIESPRSLVPIPQSAAKRICQPITNLTLSPYIRKCLVKLDIETIEDILRYALKKGLDSLLDLPGFGRLGLDQLKFQLEKHKIIDKRGHSDLYQYIICEPES